MKRIIEYLPLLSVFLIYFGFCNMHSYYLEFHIDIYAYITTSEIIMAFFPTMVVVASIASASMIQEFIVKPVVVSVPAPQEDIESLSRVRKFILAVSRNVLSWMLVYFLLDFSIKWGLKHYFGYQPYDFQTYNIFSGLFFLIGGLWFLAYTGQREIVRKSPAILAMFVVFFAGNQINRYRKLDAEKIKVGIVLRELSFKYRGRTVSTNKQLMYIGQTIGHLFLYDRTGGNTFVYKTSELDSLVLKH